MNKPGLILIGAGGHANACIDVIEQQGDYQIVGLVGLPQEIHNRQLGYEVNATDQELDQLAKSYRYAMIAIGQMQTSKLRVQLYQLTTHYGFQMPAIISPTAQVSRHAYVGAGSIIMHGAIVNAGAKVGNNCIINSRALIEHDTLVEDHCHISTGAILNGDTSIGAGTFIGSGAVIKEGVLIGANSLVGMGLMVRHNVDNNVKYLGTTKS